MAIQRQFIRELSFGRLSVVNEMAIPFSRLHSNANAYRGCGGGGGGWWASPIITARKQSLQRLCFHRCLSAHGGSLSGGGVLSKREGSLSKGDGSLSRGVCVQGGLCPGGSLSGGGGLGGLCPGETGFLSRMD